MSDSEGSGKGDDEIIKRTVSTSMQDNSGFQFAWVHVFTALVGIFLGLGAGVLFPTVAKERPAKFSMDSLPQHVVDVEYAVRGPIVSRALQIKQQLEDGVKFPFDEIVSCNVGNPQAVGQKPITYHRQVLSLLAKAPPANGDELVEFLEQEKETVPADVFGRAQAFRSGLPLGSYTHSKGALIAREYVADFISGRDGVGAVDPDSIYLTDGASPGVKTSLQLLLEGPDDGVLIPIPQYPLYSAAITMNRGTAAGYYLDESKGWSVTKEVIEDAIKRFKQERPNGVLRGLVVINPGNPTGNILSYDELSMIIDLCKQHDLVLMADEVYQANIWTNVTFVSARKVLLDKKSDVPLFSFHSISKGFTGECGIRGGYMQVENIGQDVQDEIYKMQSVSLCANSVGQMMTASIMNPPVAGDPSWPLFKKEYYAIKNSQYVFFLFYAFNIFSHRKIKKSTSKFYIVK